MTKEGCISGVICLAKALFLALFIPAKVIAQWERLSLDSRTTFRAVHAADKKNCWIGGAGGQIWRTDDGGDGWIRCGIPPGGDSLDFRDIHAFSANEAVVMSSGEAEKGKARIYRTADGGRHWDLVFQTKQKGAFLDAMDFREGGNGICLGDPVDGKFFLAVTADSGRTWSELPAARRPPAAEGEAAFAASGSSVAMVGNGLVLVGTGGTERARILRSENGGKTWEAIETSLPAGTESGIFGLKFWSEKEGVALGGNYRTFTGGGPNLIYTRDGGRSWAERGPAPPAGLKESAGIYKKRYLVAAGHSGSSYSPDNGRTWIFLDASPWHAVSFTGDAGFAVGAGGLVARFKGIP